MERGLKFPIEIIVLHISEEAHVGYDFNDFSGYNMI